MITQSELASLVGVTIYQINRIENLARNAGLKTQRKICEVLGCTRDQLLRDTLYVTAHAPERSGDVNSS